MATNTINLIKCGVCNGKGTLTHIDWNSAATIPPRQSCRCWLCGGEGKHPALPDDYHQWLESLPTPEPAPVKKHAFISLRCRYNTLRISRHQRRTSRRYALANVTPSSRARLQRLTDWPGWSVDAQDTPTGAVVALLHRP